MAEDPRPKICDLKIETAQVEYTQQDAIEELVRETNVRARLYDRWVAEGKLTYRDARTRYLCCILAIYLLENPSQLEAEEEIPY